MTHPRAIELLPANTAADTSAILAGWLLPDMGGDRLIRRFEGEFASRLGGGVASAFSAGRVALSAILDAIGVGAGDEVVVPGYTCVAVPNPILFAGARPVYADIDPATLNITAQSVEQVLTTRTRAIVAQHTFGLPAPMTSLCALARSRGIPVIEDCTHALGATYGGHAVGTLGEAAFFSFEQTKVVSAGAGGVAFTRDAALGARIQAFQARCIPMPARQARQMMGHLAYSVFMRDPRWAARFTYAAYYLSRLGLVAGPETTAAEMNCERPASFARGWSGAQARVGLSQLERLDWNLEQRRTIARTYHDRLAGTRIGLFSAPAEVAPAFVRVPVRVRDKFKLAGELRESGIQLGLWFTAPVHPAGVPQARAGYEPGTCPNAERAVAEVANLPCHPRMVTSDAVRVAEALLRSAHA